MRSGGDRNDTRDLLQAADYHPQECCGGGGVCRSLPLKANWRDYAYVALEVLADGEVQQLDEPTSAIGDPCLVQRERLDLLSPER